MPDLAEFIQIEIAKDGSIRFNKLDVSEDQLRIYLQQTTVFRRSNESYLPMIVLSTSPDIDCEKLNKVVRLIEDESECGETLCTLNPTDYFSYGGQQ